MPRHLLPTLILCLAPLAPHAATLRDQATLEGQEVHLADLFDGVGPQADRVLGNAPAPGNQLVIEAAQLAAIARQFGVEWRPASGAEHIVLDRPGRLLPREDAIAALRIALPRGGAAADCDIELPAFAAPLVPLATHLKVDAEQLDYESGTGRFTAVLVISGDHMTGIHTRVAGRAQDMIELPVPTRRILPGEVLAAADLHPARVRGSAVHSEVAQTVADAIGLQARHPLAPGLPLALADLKRPDAVHKGTSVVISLVGNGIAVGAVGQAMDSGPVGGHVRVLNTASRAIIEADVIGPDQVAVAVGSHLLTPARLAAR